MISLDQPLDLNDPQADEFLAGIQGNILKGHSRNFANHIFLEFGSDTSTIRTWIAEFARTRVVSALRQTQHTALWRQSSKRLNLTFVNFLLSYEGYQALGIPAAQIPVDTSGNYFQNGMKRPGTRPFNDPPVSAWQPEFQQSIHALIILANDDRALLAVETQALMQQLAPLVKRCWAEDGLRLTRQFPAQPQPVTVVHFGFKDGISDPETILQDAEEQRAARGWDQWDPAAPLNLLLSAEPGATDRYGSFMVFRKLEQDAQAFEKQLAGLAAALGQPDIELAAAMVVGRYRDGRPLLLPDQIDGNNFNYKASDPQGKTCPFQAHIRKNNPRGDTPLWPDRERALRIARRGVSYGDRPDWVENSELPPPSGGIGLLFQSFQAGLDQFAIQQEGDDSNDFVQQGVGVDALNGRNGNPTPQHWPAGSAVSFTMANFIRMLGGEYFFAPSMAFLYALSEGE
ncbi:MAG TPA: hypothetical protein VGD58_06255 [Herpetosiphonaceae bacterium]